MCQNALLLSSTLQAICRAFEVLSDEQLRQRYEHTRFGSARQAAGRGSGSSSERGNGSASRRGARARGEPVPADVVAVLQLGFREAALGTCRSLDLDVQDACPQCYGTGGQPGSYSPPCSMCKGRREIVKRRGAEQAAGKRS